MLLTREECKWLENDPSNNEQYIFVGKGKATEEYIEMLKNLDLEYFDLNGVHLISNYQDL